MATHRISTNTSQGMDTEADNEKWIVDAGVVVDVPDDNAFFGGRSYTRNRYEISGTVQTTGNFNTFYMLASHTWVTVMGTGEVDSLRSAVYIRGDRGTLINRGSIDAVEFGARFLGDNAFIKNEGSIVSDNTAVGVNGAKSEVENYGSLSGRVGIAINATSGSFDFYNSSTGTLEGSKYAYVGGNARERLVNEGQIIGDVFLRNDNDTFVSHGGTVTGVVAGGNGNDLYRLDTTALNLVELKGGGVDTVSSSVTFTLGNYFENLILTGTDLLDGTGNRLRNTITGNDANNTIHGLGGADTVSGGRGRDLIFGDNGNDVLHGDAGRDQIDGGEGNDVLYGDSLNDRISGGAGRDRIVGGAGNDRLLGGRQLDTFVFADGFGKDRIGDFVATGKTHDVIDLSDVTSIVGFADLRAHHMHAASGNVVIEDGADSIVLVGVRIRDLTVDDFLF